MALKTSDVLAALEEADALIVALADAVVTVDPYTKIGVTPSDRENDDRVNGVRAKVHAAQSSLTPRERMMKDAPRDGTPINIRLRHPNRGPGIYAMRWRNGRFGERWYAATDYSDLHMDTSINDLPSEEADWAPIIFEE